MVRGPAAIDSRETGPKSYATSSGPKHRSQAYRGPSGTRSPHSRQASATAAPKSAVIWGSRRTGDTVIRRVPPHLSRAEAGRTWHLSLHGYAHAHGRTEMVAGA